VAGVDRQVCLGPDLPRAFAEADLVISTAGYNSVLELACTTVPTLLIPIPRQHDDQEDRVRRWGRILGKGHSPAGADASATWMSQLLDRRERRGIYGLGPSGAERAARYLMEALS
jgi:predicted glycosyltransferase